MNMVDLFVVILTTAFLFALKPGGLTLLAFQRVLTHSFFSGWVIGAGSTAGQAAQAFGIVAVQAGRDIPAQALAGHPQGECLCLYRLDNHHPWGRRCHLGSDSAGIM